MRKIFMLLLAMLTLGAAAAQAPRATAMTTNWKAQWPQIEKLCASQSYAAADTMVRQLMQAARDERSSRNILTAAWYLARIESCYQEDAADSALARYQSILPGLDPADQAICHAFLAQFYHNYDNCNRWSISRNKATDEPSPDYKLWPLEKFNQVVAEHISQALAAPEVLQQIPAAEVQPFCQAEPGGLLVTPTLFDVLVNLAVESTGDPAERVRLHQRLLDFHSADDACLRLCLDLEHLKLLDQLPNRPKLTADDYQACLDRYPATTCQYAAELLYLAALCCEEPQDYLRALQYYDECARRFPENNWGRLSAGRAEEIRLPHIGLDDIGTEIPGREMLASVSVRNADTIRFRIIKSIPVDGGTTGKNRTLLLRQQPLKEWTLALPRRDDHQQQQYYYTLPALPAGLYMLLASTAADFKSDGFEMREFGVCDARLVSALPYNNALDGYLLRRSDGSPIARQEVELARYDCRSGKYVPCGSKAVTDADGFYHIDYPSGTNICNIRARAVVNGVELTNNANKYTPESSREQLRADILPDRPVYKPGETVSFAVVCHQGDGYQTGQAAAGASAGIELKDVNWETVDTLRLTADEYGCCHGSFVIPEDGLPGSYSIQVKAEHGGLRISNQQYIRVEAYKQPKFAVTLNPADGVRAFGQEAAFEGLAASYSQVPVSGARVSYRVERRQMRPPWRWWHDHISYNAAVVARGTLATDHEGRFCIAFVPQPDSSIDLSHKPCFSYTLTVDVTDLNGETHSQQHTLRVGYQNCYLAVSQTDRSDRLEEISFVFNNLDEKPVAGDVQVTLERLVLPQQPLLAHPHGAPGIRHTLSPEEFAKRFPAYQYDYPRSGIASLWPVERRCLAATVRTHAGTPSASVRVDGELPSGYYRVCLAAADPVSGQPLADTAILFYQHPDDRQCVSNSLLYSRVSSNRCEAGDTLALQIGSRHAGLTVCYALTCGSRVVERRLIPLSCEVKSIPIAVPEEFLGGFGISLFAVKDNVSEQLTHSIQVPYSHKELDVAFASFRDKLQPGETETWTLRIKPKAPARRAVLDTRPSTLTLTMYDAALDTYGSLQWKFQPWSSRSAGTLFHWNDPSYTSLDLQRTIAYRSGTQPIPLAWELRNGINPYSGGYGSARGEDGMVMMKSAPRAAKMTLAANAAETAEEEVFSIVETQKPGGLLSILPEARWAKELQNVPLQTPIRSNLSTLAFFAPALHADAEGTVSYTFTVPELLTRWSIRGLACTPDLMHGSLQAGLVTQKQLMVQPNVPRFLRHGDQLGFMAKVSNISDQEQQVAVTFELSDAADGHILSHQRENLSVAAGSTQPVVFDIQVPSDLFAANYKIVAQGQSCSDGEQGLIPVLSNRELVTASQSMYMNGAGERHYGLDSLHLGLEGSSSAQPLRFALEFSANPVWYAVQALPYLQDRENPSHIYLANSLYANSLASRIVKQHPAIQTAFRQWGQDTINPLVSQLEKNSDVKSIILAETPWLREGSSETDRMHRIAAYFDAEAVGRRLADDKRQLLAGQRPDGGWCWMPGGSQSSLYVTQYILKCLGRLGETQGKAVSDALAYADRETYDYYKRYLKRTDCEPVNLEYLFLRSLYPGKSFAGKSKEAYDFFYANALKHYKEYSSLYSRALLALVFQRHGDRKQAQDIVRRLRECALYSDEMGMYWRDNTASCWWYQRPVETQSMIIQAFAEVTPDDRQSVALMQQWLLKQKQTTSWCSDVATADAVTALLCGSNALSPASQPARVTVGGILMDTPAQAGTGYQSQRWTGDSLTALRSSLRSRPEIVIRKQTDGIAWGAAYYQYFEDLDKIPSLAMGIAMTKQLFVVQPDGSLQQIAGENRPAVGSRVRVRLLLAVDRNLEYVQIKDGRASCLEPVSTASGWHWDGGISYYAAVGSTSASFFIDRLDKGKYVLEYDLFVTNAGRFTTAPATAQCLYAPEFRATAPSPELIVR